MSAANAHTEFEMPTPVSRSEKLAMLIWDVWLFGGNVEQVDGVEVSQNVQLTKESVSASLAFEDDDLVAGYHRQVSQQDQGSLSEYITYQELAPGHWNFSPPMLYTKSKLFLSSDSAGATAVRAFAAKVGYTLERVDPNTFIAALVE